MCVVSTCTHHYLTAGDTAVLIYADHSVLLRYIHMEKVREHLLCYTCKLWTKMFLRFGNVLTKLFS